MDGGEGRHAMDENGAGKLNAWMLVAALMGSVLVALVVQCVAYACVVERFETVAFNSGGRNVLVRPKPVYPRWIPADCFSIAHWIDRKLVRSTYWDERDFPEP